MTDIDYYRLLSIISLSINCVWCTIWVNRELKHLRWRRRRHNSSARASRFLEHFLDVHCMTTTWNLRIWPFMEDVDIRQRIFLALLNLNNVLTNSTPGKVAYIWHIERVQIDAIKFERTQISSFFSDVFTAFVVVIALNPWLVAQDPCFRSPGGGVQ